MTTHWVYLTRDDVAAIHDRITSAPIRDENLLLSAVDKPWASYMGVEVYPNLEDKAAALLIGLSRNHPFVDGNKRTAIGAANVFLRANGYRLVFASDESVADFVEIVAQGQVEQAFVAAWMRAFAKPLKYQA